MSEEAADEADRGRLVKAALTMDVHGLIWAQPSSTHVWHVCVCVPRCDPVCRDASGPGFVRYVAGYGSL